MADKFLLSANVTSFKISFTEENGLKVCNVEMDLEISNPKDVNIRFSTFALYIKDTKTKDVLANPASIFKIIRNSVMPGKQTLKGKVLFRESVSEKQYNLINNPESRISFKLLYEEIHRITDSFYFIPLGTREELVSTVLCETVIKNESSSEYILSAAAANENNSYDNTDDIKKHTAEIIKQIIR